MTTLAELEAQVQQLWRPPPRLNLSEWADEKFMLPAGDANAGRWHTLPYQRGILDAISDPNIERVTWMKSARVGYTKCFCAAIGYFIEHDPCPIMVVQPTLDDARRHSKEDVAPMLAEIPELRGLVAEARAKDSNNTTLDKPLAIDTPIPTPSGWASIGELKPGNEVFDEHGTPRVVLSVSAVVEGRPCYRLKFSDGSSIVADADHGWPVEWWRVEKRNGIPTQTVASGTLTTAEIARQVTRSKRFKYAIRRAGALDLPRVDLPIDPYVLGVWLGDGFSHAAWIGIGHQDATEIADHLRACGYGVTVQSARRSIAVLVLDVQPRRRHQNGRMIAATDGVRAQLRNLGLLKRPGRAGGASRKHIPPAYLRASREQRLALLQGLMDTDGHVTPSGSGCTFMTSIPALADGVADLLAGLGMVFTRTATQPYYSYRGARCAGATAWKFWFTTAERPVFRLARKLTRQMTGRRARPLSRNDRRRIVAVEATSSVPVRCITVDSASHLFLAGPSMIPTHNSFRGGSLSLIGANSPRGFRRTSRRVVIFDEVDGYPQSAGTEGDPIELGIRRTEYYWNRKILAGSTPTLAGYSVIERLFDAGDQRRYYVPCPSCGAFQVLRFPNLKWPEGQPERAYLVCEAEGCVIEHRSKRAMIEAGEWRAEKPEHFTEHNRHASFHLWAGYSYSPNATWGQLAAEFVKATRGGTLTLRTFINTVLGETWQNRGEAPEWERLMRRRDVYAIGTVPAGALFLTAGVDVQKDRLIYEVVGWGRGKTSWSIDYVILPGDTADLDHGPWPQLNALLARVFPHAGGVELPIRMLAVDSGYNTQQVYAWARTYPMSRVIAVKGQAMGGALIGPPTAVDVSDRGRKLRRSYKAWPVVGAIAKSELYGWLRLETPTDGSPPPPGFCHFPEYNDSYFRELTAEQLIPHKTARGFIRLEWTLIEGRQNHALDCFDSETEVLTRDGWRRFDALKGEEQLATVNLATDAIQYQRPSALIARPYDGSMLKLGGRKLDVLVTPEHRMVTIERSWRPGIVNRPPEITLAKDLRARHSIKCAATWRGRRSPAIQFRVALRGQVPHVATLDPGDFAEFLGWYVSDGWGQRTVSKRPPPRIPQPIHMVLIAQKPGPKSDRIAALLARLPWRWCRYGIKFATGAKPLYDYLEREVGHGAANKRVPAWIKAAPPEIIARFVDAAVLGDGWTRTSAGRKIRFFSTVSQQLADDMQELFLKLGRAANISKLARRPRSIQGYRPSPAQPEYVVTESVSDKRSLHCGSKFIGKWVHYVGMVYCATVPNGTLICRRNGRAFIAGNCRVYARAAAAVLGLDRFTESDWASLEAGVGRAPTPPPPPAGQYPVAPPPVPPAGVPPRPGGWLGPRRRWLNRG